MLDPNTTAPPRSGEELNVAALAAYLRGREPGLFVDEVIVEQFPSGHSNLTYLVRAGSRDYVLRRPPFGTQVKSAHDMGREFRVLSHLHSVYEPAPKPLLYCEDPAVLGAPFYLMARLRGLVIRKDLPEGLRQSPDTCRQLSKSVVSNLVRLHSLDIEAAGLSTFGKPNGYVARQIDGWTRRWADCRTKPIPDMDEVATWLYETKPIESGAALIHNDYKLDNLLLDPADPSRIVGVLDWEMATVGDPLMDLGGALAYWVEPTDPGGFLTLRFSPTAYPGFCSRQEFAAQYAAESGRDVSHIVYYYVYGLFKLAVILQQIYYRWFHGLTKDDRFAAFDEMVAALAAQASAAMRSGRL